MAKREFMETESTEIIAAVNGVSIWAEGFHATIRPDDHVIPIAH